MSPAGRQYQPGYRDVSAPERQQGSRGAEGRRGKNLSSAPLPLRPLPSEMAQMGERIDKAWSPKYYCPFGLLDEFAAERGFVLDSAGRECDRRSWRPGSQSKEYQ